MEKEEAAANNHRHILIKLISEKRITRSSENDNIKAIQWAKTFDAWLVEREAMVGRRVRTRETAGWSEFLNFCKKFPWEVTTNDVQRWVTHQLETGQAASTIQGHLTGLSKFFDYCELMPAKKQRGKGGKKNLFKKDFNPVRGVKRPQPEHRQENLTYLNREELRALLKSVDKEETLIGKRDYAMLILVLSTAQRMRQVRRLQWKDIKIEGNQTWLTWKRGTKIRQERLHKKASEAIQNFLKSSGRLPRMQESDYVFAPVRTPRGINRQEWEKKHPLSPDQIRKLLNQYARCAGIKTQGIKWQCLRNTAVILQIKKGESLEYTKKFLGKSSDFKIKSYLRRLEGLAKAPLWEDGHPPTEEKKPIQRENPSPPIKHGWYSKHLLAEVLSKEEIRDLDLFSLELIRLRIIIDKSLSTCETGDLYEENFRKLSFALRAIGRSIRIKKTIWNLRGVNTNNFDWKKKTNRDMTDWKQEFEELAKKLEEEDKNGV